MIAKQLTEIN